MSSSKRPLTKPDKRGVWIQMRFGRKVVVNRDELRESTEITPRLHAELANLLPADFNRPVVLKTERLDAYDLLDPKSKASKTVQSWLDDLPDGALLVWRPPRRPWVVIVPAGEVEGVEFEYGLSFGAWRVVGLGEWVEALKGRSPES